VTRRAVEGLGTLPRLPAAATPVGSGSGRNSLGVRVRSDGQNRGMAGRKRLLTPDLASALAEKVAAGQTVEAASTSFGLSSRSVRRWRAEGEQELSRLSAEAQLALELTRPRDRAEPHVDWQVSAQTLDALLAELSEERLLGRE
jgi:hypothetical protein